MKSRFILLMALLLLAALFTSCATSGDLQKLQSQVNDISAKADQAARDAAAANSAAQAATEQSAKAAENCNAAATKAADAAARADAAAKLAEDNAKKTEAIFMKSMRK